MSGRNESENYNPKSRGRERVSAKKHYGRNNIKSKSKLVNPHPKSKTTIDLGSNWNRYEILDEDEGPSSSTDFSLLSRAPITTGSHFQFKSDKTDSLGAFKPSEFNLNLSMLSMGLSTIPFNIRSGIDEDYFSEDQKSFMNKTAVDNLKKHETFLKNCVLDEVMFDSSSESEGDETEEEKKSVDEVDVCKVSGGHLSDAEKVLSEDHKSDLEQWLDDVLDD